MQKTIVIAAVALIGFLGVTQLPRANGGTGRCEWRHFAYNGPPDGRNLQIYADLDVPEGRTWRVTNASILVEEHLGPPIQAGEFTAALSVIDNGQRIVIGESSLETDNGVNYQGQGIKNVVLDHGTSLEFLTYLNPNRDAPHYFFNISASVRDCPVH